MRECRPVTGAKLSMRKDRGTVIDAISNPGAFSGRTSVGHSGAKMRTARGGNRRPGGGPLCSPSRANKECERSTEGKRIQNQ